MHGCVILFFMRGSWRGRTHGAHWYDEQKLMFHFSVDSETHLGWCFWLSIDVQVWVKRQHFCFSALTTPISKFWAIRQCLLCQLLSKRWTGGLIQILITCSNTFSDTIFFLKKMVQWKFTAPLLWKMIDIYQKESNNSINLLEEMEVTPANIQVHRIYLRLPEGRSPGWNRERTKAESFLIDFDSY